MSGSVGDGTAAVGLASSAEILGLTSEGSLINFALLRSREWHTIRLKLKNSVGGLLGHVVNGVLISEPIRTLHGIVEVPSPIILVHVAECSINTALYSNCKLRRVPFFPFLNFD